MQLTDQSKLLGMNLTGITAKLIDHSQSKFKTRQMQPHGLKMSLTATERTLNTKVSKLALLAAIAIFQ